MGELRLEEEKAQRTWEAFLSWREHPPTRELGSGKRKVIPFNTFLAQLKLADPPKAKAGAEITDAELERLEREGHVR